MEIISATAMAGTTIPKSETIATSLTLTTTAAGADSGLANVAQVPGFLDTLGWEIPTSIAVVASIAAIFMAYRLLPKFRFWCFDIWADLPLIGTVARQSRMSPPTTEEANSRMDSLFHAYQLHMPNARDEEEFGRVRQYLHLAGDNHSKPLPFYAVILLLVMMSFEAFTFSYLLGLGIGGDISESTAMKVGYGIALIVALILLILGHMSGHQMRRTKEIRDNLDRAVDRTSFRKEKEAKGKAANDEISHADLTRRIALEDTQDQDKSKLHEYQSQRFLNRARKTPTDKGSYLWPILYLIAITILSWLQYQLRMEVVELGGQQQEALKKLAEATWTNASFTLIFFLTQGLAIMFGYRFGFLGADSERGYKMIAGKHSYADYEFERKPMVMRADESLRSLLAKFKSNYPGIRESLDERLFEERETR